MAFQPVSINSATADEIATLYDISTRRAAAIVTYRQAHGPFHGPTDLAQVPDISSRLAFFLTPHIDWRLPDEPMPEKKRSWSEAFIWIVVLLCLLSATMLLVVLVILALRQGMAVEPYRLVAGFCGIGALVGFVFFAALRLGVALTRNRDRAHWLARGALGVMALTLFVGVPILLIGGIYWWFVSGGAAGFRADQLLSPTVVGVVALCLLYLLITPQLIVWWRPQLADARWLAAIFDSAFLLGGLLLTLGVRVQIGGWSPWFLLLAALAGVMLITVAIVALRRGDSFFLASLDMFHPQRRTQRIDTLDRWRYWLNTYLPLPANQRDVQTLLNDIYRPQTGRLVLLGALGWWLLGTAVGAIVQFHIQGWWQLLLAWFGS